jgi:glutamine synthetase
VPIDADQPPRDAAGRDPADRDPVDVGDVDAVRGAIERSSSDYVKVAIVDIDGVLRGKYLDRAKVLSALGPDGRGDGFGFCDVVFGWDVSDDTYDNATYTGWHTGYPDGKVRLDPTTFRRIPWEADRPFLLGDYVGSAAGFDVCPRLVLSSVVERAAAAGYEGRFGLEFEWFNFLETPGSLHAKDFRDLTPLTPGMFGYSVLRQSQDQELLDALLRELRAFDVPLEGLHTETGPGVLEAAIQYGPALVAADRAALFKSGTKEIAQRFGILPTFMARWNAELPGCSGHTHQSLVPAGGGPNLFADESDPAGMSPLFRSYLAGILALLPECLPLLAPTVNSYKRLVDGFWAPTTTTWGIDNRTVAARVINASPAATRLELRVPGSDVNPYLAVAFSLAAGLHGIERKLELGEATTGSGYQALLEQPGVERLPRTLEQATEAMHESGAARELLGDGFVDHFCATREWEWRKYQDAVTDWELRRYLEII